MRVFVCALLTTFFISNFAAAADKPPLERAGEWQRVQVSERGKGFDDVDTACVGDRWLLAKFDTMPHCSRKEAHTEGDTTIADAQCKILGSAVSYHEKIMKLDDDNFYIYLHVTVSPPALYESEILSFTHLKRLGACRTGETPLK